MDTSQLRAFLKIAEAGSISRAAESLGIAQPSLSQQLLRLEDEAGFKLFHRTAKGVTITEAGRIFQERVRQILISTEQALEDARHLKTEASGQVVLAMPPTVCRMVAVALYELLRVRAPLVKLRIVGAFSGTIRGWLEAGKIDMGVLYDLGVLRNLSTRRLVDDELFLVGRDEAFGTAVAPPTIAVSRLKGQTIITSGPQHGLRRVLEREISLKRLELGDLIEVDALEPIKQMAAAGLGYAFLPLSCLADETARGELDVARLEGAPVMRRLSLVRNPASMVTQASVIVEDLMVEVVQQLARDSHWTIKTHVLDDKSLAEPAHSER